MTPINNEGLIHCKMTFGSYYYTIILISSLRASSFSTQIIWQLSNSHVNHESIRTEHISFQPRSATVLYRVYHRVRPYHDTKCFIDCKSKSEISSVLKNSLALMNLGYTSFPTYCYINFRGQLLLLTIKSISVKSINCHILCDTVYFAFD